MRVSESAFEELLKDKVQDYWDRALKMFHEYGPALAWDVTNVLLHGADQGKTDEVLKTLEEHWSNHLYRQHPQMRGHFDELFGSPTKDMFQKICADTLSLPLPV